MTSNDDATNDTKGLFTSERAVSPVIGVILMVAITVILAAVIGTFVLGLGQNVGNAAPQATLSVSASSGADSTSGTVTVEHDGGDSLHSDRTRIIIETGGTTATLNPDSTDASFSVGDSNTIDAVGDTISSGTWSSVGYTNDGSSISNIASGDAVRIELIDTESQRVIFETEVTAG